MDITMSRVHSASDTCDIYFTYIKVNPLLYTCSLDPFEDGILLDPPSCMHRYCRSFTDDEEECKRQGSPTPSAREAWKRRKKKPGQASGKPGTSGRCPELPATGTSGHPGASGPAAPKPSESVPTLWIARTLPGPSPGTSGARTFRPSPELPALPARRHSGRSPCTLSPLTYPFVDLDYIYSSTSSFLGLALV